MIGWIKLHRNLREWEWYDDINATRLLIHLLISVNYEPKKWKGELIAAGSMVLSWETLSNQCGLSVMQCRTSMKKLISSGEVTSRSTSKYQVVTLTKWEKLQHKDGEVTSKLTDKQQASNKQVTTTKEVKETKEDKKKEIEGRKLKFASTLEPFLDVYGRDLINDFYFYWTEPNKSNTKFKQELERTWSLKRRLETWAKNEMKYNPKQTSRSGFTAEEAAILNEQAQKLIDNDTRGELS